MSDFKPPNWENEIVVPSVPVINKKITIGSVEIVIKHLPDDNYGKLIQEAIEIVFTHSNVKHYFSKVEFVLFDYLNMDDNFAKSGAVGGVIISSNKKRIYLCYKLLKSEIDESGNLHYLEEVIIHEMTHLMQVKCSKVLPSIIKGKNRLIKKITELLNPQENVRQYVLNCLLVFRLYFFKLQNLVWMEGIAFYAETAYKYDNNKLKIEKEFKRIEIYPEEIRDKFVIIMSIIYCYIMLVSWFSVPPTTHYKVFSIITIFQAICCSTLYINLT